MGIRGLEIIGIFVGCYDKRIGKNDKWFENNIKGFNKQEFYKGKGC